ncbi:helix-turn-helix domain-containing protein [Murdochiella vaginalis]|uniref:helix-turn-helix domain-containing protein n=1 Tax=Murdochiella vaginalis TaxID=1852373 RepID=UPI0008FE48DA|nr:helix-turn-helix transcriptional regulator [Murdochiella vaginalis]
MVNLSSLNLRRHSLQRRLFLTMLVLSMLLLSLFFVGLYFVLGYTDTKQRMDKNLNFQLDIFARETSSYYKNLATMSILLSRESGGIVENYLSENHIAFDDLNNSQEHLVDIQKQLFDPLRHKLFEANCTGAFIMLQATVDTKSNHADASRTGLYLQRGTLDASDNDVLLYRGFSSIGRNKGYMPHRKWRLEFDTDLFPNYADLLQHAKAPLTTNFCTTEIFTLPGTSEKAMLMVVPLLGSHGEVYGICGLEVNQSYFKQAFAQPSPLNRATFCLSKGKREFVDAKDCFSAGITSGYYSAPLGSFATKPFGQSLSLYENASSTSYIGASKEITIFPKNVDFTLHVLVPKPDYDYLAIQNMFRVVSLIALFLLLAAGLCIYFSTAYLIPLKKSIQKIQQKTYMATDSSIAEIDDLFVFLDEENRANEELLENMEQEKKRAEKELQKMQEEYDKITQKIERLAYSRKNEIDPADYENFKIGFKLLTKREKEILRLYMDGKGVKEIMEEADLKESTVRFHNRNIYSKLGVYSQKQLLRCIAILEQEEQKNSPNT